MINLELKGKMLNATKWSAITEIVAKLVTPVTNMILARLLTPEAFGVVATVTIVISFADMFTDAGFQKYIVQHEFKNEEEKHESANVAFWTNIGIALFLWGVIAAYSEQIASLVGNPGLGIVIAVSCVQLPITSFSSIQMALFKRDFHFKTLFLVRIVSVCIPFVVTIPLALSGTGYWALIVGTICGQLSNAVIITAKSKWKPVLIYRVQTLKEMISFSIWSLIEAISIWLATWVDTLIIGSVLSTYYIGLYKTSISMVEAMMGIITASTKATLFSTLSRLQNNDVEFKQMFLKTQQLVSIIVFPLGIGVYLFRELATQIFLGSQWYEASGVIGVWALAQAVAIVLCYYCSEVYRAKGRPKLSFIVQLLYMAVLIPTCIISSKYGFWPLVHARALTILQFTIIHLFTMKFAIGISTTNILKKLYPSGAAAIIMGVAGYFLQQISKGVVWSIISIILCILLYCSLLMCFPSIRKELMETIKQTVHLSSEDIIVEKAT